MGPSEQEELCQPRATHHPYDSTISPTATAITTTTIATPSTTNAAVGSRSNRRMDDSSSTTTDSQQLPLPEHTSPQPQEQPRQNVRRRPSRTSSMSSQDSGSNCSLDPSVRCTSGAPSSVCKDVRRGFISSSSSISTTTTQTGNTCASSNWMVVHASLDDDNNNDNDALVPRPKQKKKKIMSSKHPSKATPWLSSSTFSTPSSYRSWISLIVWVLVIGIVYMAAAISLGWNHHGRHDSTGDDETLLPVGVVPNLPSNNRDNSSISTSGNTNGHSHSWKPQRRPPVFPELIWKPACAHSNVDFIGVLQFCQGITDEYNNTYYGFRLNSDEECGGWWTSRPGSLSNGKQLPKATLSLPLNPLIRMQAGMRYQLILENGTPHDRTNLHLHGLHIASQGQADNVLTQAVDPGQCITYHYHLPVDHMDGVHWYHTHMFGSTRRQMNGGAFGLLIVDPALPIVETADAARISRPLPPPPPPKFVYNQRLLVLFTSVRSLPYGDALPPTVTICSDDSSNSSSSSPWPKVSYTTANGLEPGMATLDLVAGEWTRISILTVDTVDATARQLRFDDQVCQVQAVAFDGVWRNVVESPAKSSITSPITNPATSSLSTPLVFSVSGSSRIDLAVKCSADSGLWYHPRYTYDSTLLETPNLEQEEPMVHFRVSPAVAKPVRSSSLRQSGIHEDKMDDWETWIPPRPSYLQSLLAPSEIEDLHFEENGLEGPREDPHGGFRKNTFDINITNHRINNQAFYVGIPPLATLQYHTIQQWSLQYTQFHPFHLHGHHMQVVSPGGCGNVYQQGEWFDTIASSFDRNIPDPCIVRFLLRGDDGATGPVLFHCHTVSHEGAMGWVNVLEKEEYLSSSSRDPENFDGNQNFQTQQPNPWEQPGSPQYPLSQCQAEACWAY